MPSITTEPLSGVLHKKNGDNITNTVAKLVEKTDAEMREYMAVYSMIHFDNFFSWLLACRLKWDD